MGKTMFMFPGQGAQYIGMALLLALLLFANGNDIYRYFFK